MLFIFNPNAGRGLIKTKLAEIADVFVKGGFEVCVYPTRARSDALDKVTRRGADFDVIVCCGGDGTLNEVITGMLKTNLKIPLGYIPAGTMNDFASSHGIPKKMAAAAEIITNGATAEVDVGAFNGGYFTYVAGFGAFTEASYETSQQMKNIFGTLAYMLEGIKRLGTIESRRVSLIYGGIELSGDFIFGMVANSKSVAGIKGLSGRDVLLDDGIFECLLVKNPAGIAELQMMVNALLKRELDAEHFHFFKAQEIRFRSEFELPWTLDGEFGGNHKEVVISNLRRAVTVFVKA
jgi:YegS/Rv2252/BmrU family lipid kinase